MSVKSVHSDRQPTGKAERQLRIDLAAFFRLPVRYAGTKASPTAAGGGVDAPALPDEPAGPALVPLRASDLLLLDVDGADDVVGQGAGKADPTAWNIHSTIHAAHPGARCVLHTHMRYATVLACLRGYRLQMIDQNAMRFHDRIAYDDDFRGMALDTGEGRRIAGAIADGRSVLFMANHGVTVVAPSVAEAFDETYYLERACELQVLALSTGQPLHVVSDEVAAKTGRQWREYPVDSCLDHFNELTAILDLDEPDYRD